MTKRRDGIAARPLDLDRLGKIVVARLLELPPRAFERHVCALEQTPAFLALGDVLRSASLSGRPPLEVPALYGNCLGSIEVHSGQPAFRYASAAFDREYLFDEVVLEERIARKSPALGRLAGGLRLVNTRNRLTHALVSAVFTVQADYLLHGDSLRLRVLSQAALARNLRAGGCLVNADPSRLSRLLRHLTVLLPSRKVVLLRDLCPTTRDVHRCLVSHILKEERAMIMEDWGLDPLTDRQIAHRARHRFGVSLLPRTVAYIRDDLGIPAARERKQRFAYLSATFGFSSVLPLIGEAIREEVPSVPGVYEIRRHPGPQGVCPVIYLGSGRNLPLRLLSHLRGYSRNGLLRSLIQAGGARFRYLPVTEGWREAERRVYHAFCATFGGPPLCNRMSP